MIESAMRNRVAAMLLGLILGSGFLTVASAQKRRLLPTRLLMAKSVFFDNETGFSAVGGDAIRELQKWGRFQVVQNREQADLVFILSSQENLDDLSDLGPPSSQDFEPDWFLHFHRRPANDYLTVIDTITGERLWFGSHVWGGLLTGFNSAGRRLVHRLRNQIELR